MGVLGDRLTQLGCLRLQNAISTAKYENLDINGDKLVREDRPRVTTGALRGYQVRDVIRHMDDSSLIIFDIKCGNVLGNSLPVVSYCLGLLKAARRCLDFSLTADEPVPLRHIRVTRHGEGSSELTAPPPAPELRLPVSPTECVDDSVVDGLLAMLPDGPREFLTEAIGPAESSDLPPAKRLKLSPLEELLDIPAGTLDVPFKALSAMDGTDDGDSDDEALSEACISQIKRVTHVRNILPLIVPRRVMTPDERLLILNFDVSISHDYLIDYEALAKSGLDF